MRTGIAGVGFMSWIHYLAHQRCESAEVVAFCSRDPAKRAGDWTSIRGNFGPPGEHIDVAGVRAHASLDELIADDTVDLIDLCLPPRHHEPAIRKCLAAGKKVLCEKPLTLSGSSARSLVQSIGDDGLRAGALMVAHVLPFMPEFKFLVDAAADGRFGRPIAGRFNRVISPPDWIPDFYDADSVGGPLVDLHVHDAHLIRLLFGMPSRVDRQSIDREGVPKRYEMLYKFEQPAAVSAGGGVIDSPARPFTHGYELSFDRATVRFESAAYADGSAAEIPLTVMHADGRVERPEVGGGDPVDAFAAEISAAAAWADRGVEDQRLHPNIAADALVICGQ